MEYKVGELFYDVIQGLCCVTEVSAQSICVFSKPFLPNPLEKTSYSIGKYTKLLDNREYLLYPKSRHRIATDEDIIEYLTNTMLNFKVSDKVTVSLYKNCDFVYFNDYDNSIAIHRDNIKSLLELLNRELNF
jgi:hypothetical protein